MSRRPSNAPRSRVRVVLTLRADFYDHCAQYPDLREALGRHQVYIGPLKMSQLGFPQAAIQEREVNDVLIRRAGVQKPLTLFLG